jgi:hypothetical protein
MVAKLKMMMTKMNGQNVIECQHISDDLMAAKLKTMMTKMNGQNVVDSKSA